MPKLTEPQEKYDKVTPQEVMNHNLEQGSITLSEYMQWLMTDQTWDSIRDFIIGSIEDKVNNGKTDRTP